MSTCKPTSAKRAHVSRFLVAGALNTCFGYAAFAFCIWIGLANDAAVICGMLAGVAFNFGTFRRVFDGKGLRRVPAFMLLYAALLLFNILLLRAFVSAGTGPSLGQAIVVILTTPISFLALKRFVFATASEHMS